MRTFSFFFLIDAATSDLYTLSLHDALPISFKQDALAIRARIVEHAPGRFGEGQYEIDLARAQRCARERSEEHTSELQSRENLVCRLLLEKKKSLKNDKRLQLIINNPFLDHQ